VFYQPTAPGLGDAEREVGAALELAGDRLVVKLAATAAFVGLAHRVRAAGTPVALTAVYAAGQALVAASLGCAWVIPYVDRARRLAPDEPPVVPALAAVLAGLHGDGAPRILAASVKSPAQAVAAVTGGAHGITAPLAVLEQLVSHPLSDAALAEFDAATRAAAAGAQAVG
jgi:transaldolase